MEISAKERRVFSEVDSFLELLGQDYIDKIPEDIRKVFKEEKDKTYEKKIDQDLSIESQGFMKESIDTILWLNLEFWCTNEEERDVLQKMYENNQKIAEEIKKEKYNPEKLFSSPSNNQDALMIKDNSKNIFFKIIDKIKNFFKRKENNIQDEM